MERLVGAADVQDGANRDNSRRQYKRPDGDLCQMLDDWAGSRNAPPTLSSLLLMALEGSMFLKTTGRSDHSILAGSYDRS